MHMSLNYEIGRMIVAERLAQASEARRRRSCRARRRTQLEPWRAEAPSR